MALKRCYGSLSSLLTFKHSVALCGYFSSTTRGEGTGGKEERRGTNQTILIIATSFDFA